MRASGGIPNSISHRGNGVTEESCFGGTQNKATNLASGARPLQPSTMWRFRLLFAILSPHPTLPPCDLPPHFARNSLSEP